MAEEKQATKRLRELESPVEDIQDEKRYKSCNRMLSSNILEEEQVSSQDLSALLTTLQQELSNPLPGPNPEEAAPYHQTVGSATAGCSPSSNTVVSKEDEEDDEKERTIKHLLEASEILSFLNNTMNPQTVEHISEWFIKPQHMLEEAKQPLYLGPWELPMLSLHYSQKGLLFEKPPFSNDQENPIESLIENLKDSLGVTLIHFYPLAGRLATLKQENPQIYTVFIDCNNSPGARLVHASVSLTISDILAPTDVPLIVRSFFDHNGAINHDGHTMSLLTLQVTELIDGIFIGGSVNHCVADGTSFWHFLNTLSEVFKAKGAGQSISTIKISPPPNHNFWFPDGYGPIISLPFTDSNQFICRFNPPLLRERIFHFSAAALAKLKARANAECNTTKVSTLQSLIALIWRCVTRNRCLPHDQITNCTMAINNRSRLYPPLSQNYFGNIAQVVGGMTTAGELLAREFGWAAWLLNQAVVQHDDKAVRNYVESWLQSPTVYQLGKLLSPYNIIVGSSPRFDMYGNEFGLGKAVAIRSGNANKSDGKVTLFPGREGGGSIDLEMSLSPASMTALECDEEFLDALTF